MPVAAADVPALIEASLAPPHTSPLGVNSTPAPEAYPATHNAVSASTAGMAAQQAQLEMLKHMFAAQQEQMAQLMMAQQQQQQQQVGALYPCTGLGSVATEEEGKRGRGGRRRGRRKGRGGRERREGFTRASGFTPRTYSTACLSIGTSHNAVIRRELEQPTYVGCRYGYGCIMCSPLGGSHRVVSGSTGLVHLIPAAVVLVSALELYLWEL